jgi:hypothetical protein
MEGGHMRRISIAITLTILLLASLATAQQTTSKASNNSERSNSPTPPPGPIIGGDGTPNYLAIWATTSYLLSSVVYQNGSKIGIGTTTPEATLDVYGNINASSYEFEGATILNEPNSNLFVGLGAGAAGGGSNGGSTFVGIDAGANSIGYDNTFIGYEAGGNTTGGDFNTMLGWRAGWANVSGGANTFFGYMAGYDNSGSENSFFGTNAGESTTVGVDNAFFGYLAGYQNTQGSSNAFFGENAGAQNSTGSANTFLGASAGNANTTGSDNIYINSSGPASGNESFAIRIGAEGIQSSAFIAGIYGVASSGGVPVSVNSNGQLGTQPSSLRFKEQVRDMGDSTSALMKLRPVTFLYKPEYANGERTLQYGLIAEEVAQVYPELVAYDNDGQPYSVRYQYLSTMLLNEVQKQYRRAEAAASVITAQEQKIDSQQRQLEEMQQRLARLEALMGARINTAQIDPDPHAAVGHGVQ